MQWEVIDRGAYLGGGGSTVRRVGEGYGQTSLRVAAVRWIE